MTSPFAMMPVEAFLDHRLTAIQLRVLGALYTWRNKETGVATVYREQIAKRCGYDVAVVSRATRELARLGWLVKSDGRGRGVVTEYRIWPPDAVLENLTHAVTFSQDKNLTGLDVKGDGIGPKNLTGSNVKPDRPGHTLQKQNKYRNTEGREIRAEERNGAMQPMGQAAADAIADMQRKLGKRR